MEAAVDFLLRPGSSPLLLAPSPSASAGAECEDWEEAEKKWKEVLRGATELVERAAYAAASTGEMGAEEMEEEVEEARRERERLSAASGIEEVVVSSSARIRDSVEGLLYAMRPSAHILRQVVTHGHLAEDMFSTLRPLNDVLKSIPYCKKKLELIGVAETLDCFNSICRVDIFGNLVSLFSCGVGEFSLCGLGSGSDEHLWPVCARLSSILGVRHPLFIPPEDLQIGLTPVALLNGVIASRRSGATVNVARHLFFGDSGGIPVSSRGKDEDSDARSVSKRALQLAGFKTHDEALQFMEMLVEKCEPRNCINNIRIRNGECTGFGEGKEGPPTKKVSSALMNALYKRTNPGPPSYISYVSPFFPTSRSLCERCHLCEGENETYCFLQYNDDDVEPALGICANCRWLLHWDPARHIAIKEKNNGRLAQVSPVRSGVIVPAPLSFEALMEELKSKQESGLNDVMAGASALVRRLRQSGRDADAAELELIMNDDDPDDCDLLEVY